MKKRIYRINGDIYLSSDPHFGHANIIKYCGRPFLCEKDAQTLKDNNGIWPDYYRISRKSVEMMDEALISNYNKTVPQDGILFLLGDFAMPGRDYDYFDRCRYYRNRLHCKNIYYLFGNHDGAELEELFKFAEVHGQKLYDYIPLAVLNGVECAMGHYSSLVYNKSHRGSIAFFGHSHGGINKWFKENMSGHRSLDVGIDSAYQILGDYRPFALNECLKIMENRKGHSLGDHH